MGATSGIDPENMQVKAYNDAVETCRQQEYPMLQGSPHVPEHGSSRQADMNGQTPYTWIMPVPRSLQSL